MAKINWLANKKRQLIDHRLDYGQEDAPWREMLLECALHAQHLNAREREFLFSIADWHGALTPKQNKWLMDICIRLRLITAPARPTAQPLPKPAFNRPLPKPAFKHLDPRDPHDQLVGVDLDDPPWA